MQKGRYIFNTWNKLLDFNFVEWGEKPNCLTLPTRKGADKRKLSEISDNELFDYCVENKIGYGYYCEERRRRKESTSEITEESEGTMNLVLHTQNLELTHLKSIVVIGASGVGKTTWATKHIPKPALLVTHMDDLKRFDKSRHKAILFDDVDFKHLPITSQIHIVDSNLPRSIHVRYGTVTIPKDTQKIFTCNEFPFQEHDAIKRRIYLIKA